MVCQHCQYQVHARCPEVMRQARIADTISDTPGTGPLREELRALHMSTGQVCDCQHKPPFTRTG